MEALGAQGVLQGPVTQHFPEDEGQMSQLLEMSVEVVALPRERMRMVILE
jgi:hypothetical protein